MSLTWSGAHSSLRTTTTTQLSLLPVGGEGQEVRDAHPKPSQQSLRKAESVAHLSIPKRSRSFARLPGGVGRDPGRGAREAGAVAAPPNPFGARPTAPEHPFPEVSFSPPPISLLPDLAAWTLQPAWKGVCRFVRASILKPTSFPVCATDPCPEWRTRSRNGPHCIQNRIMTPPPLPSEDPSRG